MPAKKAIDKMKQDLVVMGEMCENTVSTAIMALIDDNEDMAQQVIDGNSETNEMELTVDKDCLMLLSQGGLNDQDLRFIVAAMKIDRDLERISDLGVEIAEHVLFLIQRRTILSQIIDFNQLVEQIGQILQESILALVEGDVKLAWKIIDEHVVVHDEVALIWSEVLEIMRESSQAIERCCHILAVTKALERIADFSSNVAEEVVYTHTGKTIRHHIREHHPVDSSVIAFQENLEDHESALVNSHSKRTEKTKRKSPSIRRKM